jgi:hypothetical protein
MSLSRCVDWATTPVLAPYLRAHKKIESERTGNAEGGITLVPQLNWKRFVHESAIHIDLGRGTRGRDFSTKSCCFTHSGASVERCVFVLRARYRQCVLGAAVRVCPQFGSLWPGSRPGQGSGVSVRHVPLPAQSGASGINPERLVTTHKQEPRQQCRGSV